MAIHLSISLRLRPPGELKDWPKDVEKWTSDLAAQCPKGFWKGDRCDAHFVAGLDQPQFGEFVNLVERFERDGTAVIFRPPSVSIPHHCLIEELDDDAKSNCQWYWLAPRYEAEPSGETDLGLPTIKGTEMPRGATLVGAEEQTIWVNERFRRFVRKQKWRNFETVQLKDVGRFAADTWHLAWSDCSLGKVLDSPWTSMLDRPEPMASVLQASRKSTGNAAADRLLRLMAGVRFHIDAIFRVARGALPQSEFATLAYDTCRGPMYVRRDAKEALVAERLLREDECRPVLVEEDGKESPIWRAVPHRRVPLFTPDVLTRVRLEEAAIQTAAERNPKPSRKATLKRSLALLKSCRRANSQDFRRAATAKQIEQLKSQIAWPLPSSWEAVLRTCNGARIEPCELACDTACEIVSAPQLPKFVRKQLESEPELPQGFLPVVDSETGDYIGLDSSSIRPDGECRVMLLSHEEPAVEREWASVAEFLEDLLAGCAIG